jgi:hypothetical protein
MNTRAEADQSGQRTLQGAKDCQELALLVGQYHTHGHRALELKPSTLLELLQSFDVYRRPQRFEEFIVACEMDARGRKGLEQRSYPQADYLRGAATAARVAVQPLLEKGFKGPELGEALKRERLKALKAYKETASILIAAASSHGNARDGACEVTASSKASAECRAIQIHRCQHLINLRLSPQRREALPRPDAPDPAQSATTATAQRRFSESRHAAGPNHRSCPQIAVQQHVDIQRQTLAVRRIAAIVGLDEFQPSIQFHQRQIGKADTTN